jgi:hypothetical protein
VSEERMTAWQRVLVRLLTGVKGAGKAIEAIKAGDFVSPRVWLARRRTCRPCEIRRGAWCGEALVEVPGVSCGCLCFASTAVASKGCWSGKFAAVSVEGKAI